MTIAVRQNPVTAPRPAPGTYRQEAIDAARGIAMLLVCVSHFGFVYFRGLPAHTFEFTLIQRVGMLASPSFVTISGFLLGFLYRTHPAGMPQLKAKLIDRGLFMLTIGHLLIDLTLVPVAGGIVPVLGWGFITDVIAIGLLVGPTLIERVPAARRLALAGTGYALAWVAVVYWRPEAAALERVKEYVVGPAQFLHPRLVFDCFPLVPWLAVYIAATVIGERFGQLYAARRSAEAKSLLTRLAVACLLVGLAIKGIPFVLKSLGLLAPSVVVWTLGGPFQKQPPSPVYLALYGGLALLLLRGLLAIDERSWRRFLTAPAALGRASLVAFIAQSYLYFTLVKLWGPGYSPLWPLLLVASAASVLGVALLWGRVGSNDVLGVGYRWLAASVARPHTPLTPRPADP